MGLGLSYGILYGIMAFLWDYDSYMGFFIGLWLLYGIPYRIMALLCDSL